MSRFAQIEVPRRAFIRLLTKVAREHALPFDPLIPDETTVAAMREARTGNLPRVTSIEALKTALNADD